MKQLKPQPHPLKGRLRKLKLTQEDVATFCGVTSSWMRLVLSGHRQPNEHIKEKFAELEKLIDDENVHAE